MKEIIPSIHPFVGQIIKCPHCLRSFEIEAGDHVTEKSGFSRHPQTYLSINGLCGHSIMILQKIGDCRYGLNGLKT